MREISNLDLKIQLTNEYLLTGGVEKILDVDLLQDLEKVKHDEYGKAVVETITPRVNAFMSCILETHLTPPLHIDNYIAEYGSFIQKSFFFDQHKIETEQQVDELIDKYKDSQNILFRGQREAKWRLYSTLQRYWIWDKMSENGIDYLKFLQTIIENGRIEFEEQISNILKKNSIDALNDISVLGFLQHHNCPTPLLDWTYSFITALFFSIDDLELNDSPREIDNYFSIYFIEEEHFDIGGMRTLLSESLQTVSDNLKEEVIKRIAKNEKEMKEMEAHFREKSFFDKNKLNGSGFISRMTKIEHMINIPISYFSDKDFESGIAFSLSNSKNIKSQNGVFTWNANSSKPIEVVGNEQYSEAKLESDPEDYRFCECFNINKKLSTYILKRLNEFQLSKETIYPDKDIDAKHIYDDNKRAST